MSGPATLLEVDRLTRHHATPQGTVHAVEDVSFRLAAGEVLGLVGESGCGKSSLGRLVVRLDVPTSGRVLFNGTEIGTLSGQKAQAFRRSVQMVFQDPYGSLNPRRRIGQILQEPFSVHRVGSRAERRRWAAELLDRVSLRPESLDRYPHEFSGGQRQRICIARAIALRPKLLVCDEAVSALDVSVQAQILNLLRELQGAFGLSYLFISHDLGVIARIADRVAVMYLGTIVEIGPTAAVCRSPRHPYTQALFAAVPSVKRKPREARRIVGEPPSPFAPPPGCRFHTRCGSATERCRTEAPALRPISPDTTVACHYA
jgi:oligopeptide/dipeptide ABC transporter ATP-binding protein